MRSSDDTEARLRAERLRALEQIESSTRTFDDIVESSESVATDDEHDPEGHTIAWERQQAAALLASARTHLDQLDAALDALATGRYGTCESCGAPIGDERLSALPATAVCVSCAS